MMAPTARPLAMAAFTGVDRVKKNASFGSGVVSPRMTTSTVLLVSPGAKVTVVLPMPV